MSAPFLISEHAPSSDRAIFDERVGGWTTYGELRRLVSVVAGLLAKRSEKSLLMLFAGGTLADIVWYLAAISAGHTVMLSDPAMLEEHKRQLVERYTPEWIAGDARLGRTAGSSHYQAEETEIGGSVLVLDRPGGEAAIHADQALLLSTSGTTGSRKHVCLSRRNIESNADSIASALSIESSGRAVATLPLHYSYGLSVVNSHLRAGASIVLNHFSVIQPQFWTLVHETSANSMAGVPFVYEMLRRLDSSQISGSPIRVMTQAGGRMIPELVGQFHALMDSVHGRFFVMYGQTEATARIAILHHDDVPRKLGAVGRAIPGGHIGIQTDGATEEPDGEIVYRGPNVMLGYAESRGDLSLGDRLHHVLHTGDTGRLDADGFLHVTGRSKRMVKVSGKRVSLDEIESLVAVACPHAVVGRDDEIHVFCVDGTSEPFADVSRRLSAATGLHRTVFRVRRIDAIPLTSSGKTDYRNLSALL